MKEPSENQIQSAFFSWCAINEKKYPELSLCFAVPNGSHKSPAARSLFKATGLKPGVPDVCLPVRGVIDAKAYIGLFLEFKSKKGVLSDSQRVWIDALQNAGHYVAVVRDWVTAANVVSNYLDLGLSV